MMEKNARGYIRLLCLTAGLSLLGSGCGVSVSEQQSKELLTPVGASIDTDTAACRDVVVIETQDGVVISETYDLSFAVSGSFGGYYVTIGDFVNEGDLLAEISQDALEEEIAALEEEIAAQQAAYEAQNQLTEIDLAVAQLQLQALRENGAADGTEIALAELEYQKSQVQYRQEQELQQFELDYKNERLAQMKENLGEVRITAPCDGEIIGMVSLANGDYVTAESPVIALAEGGAGETGTLVFTSYIAQTVLDDYEDYYALIDGVRVDITYRAYSESELKRLKFYGTSLPSYFEIDGGTDISAGTYVKLCCVTSQSLNTLAVVTNAVYRDSSGYYVYLIGEDDTRSRQAVTVGVKNDVYTEILSGLEEGDVVYVPN